MQIDNRMQHGVEATVDPSEPADLMALVSEPALVIDWNRPEEDAAWPHLQEAV